MDIIAKKIHDLLLKEKKTIAVAESCTGGLVSYLLTSLPGSSKYFMLGAVTYSNRSKNKVLGVPIRTIERNGAVSGPVAKQMAEAIRKIASSDLAIALTGIAGPTGGSKEKPVGTVFIAVSNRKKIVCRRFLFKGTRSSIRKQAAVKSLQLLKDLL